MNNIFKIFEQYLDQMSPLEIALVLERKQGKIYELYSVGPKDIPVAWDGKDMLYLRGDKVRRDYLGDKSAEEQQSAQRLLQAYRRCQDMRLGTQIYEKYYWSGASYDMDFSDWIRKQEDSNC